MTLRRLYFNILCGHRIMIITILCLLGLWLCQPVKAQNPVTVKGEKFYIDHADNLRHNQMEMPDVQIAKGNVRFRYKGMTLRCDSAYFNEKDKWFKAFGLVHMTRPGGMTLDCRRMHYDGFAQMIHVRKNVVVREPGRSLRCDSLDYNMASKVANYFGGRGTLVYNGNTIVADQGDYNTDTHDANFFGNVVMRTPKYRISTPEAHGNTATGLVHVVGKSVIRTSKGEVVHTNDGTYNSKTDYMELNGRSTITSPRQDVEGDNIIYNSATGDAEGHGSVKIVDKVNHRIITGDNVFYNEKTGHSEGHGNVKIVDNVKQRTITGRDLTYNSNTHEGTGEGNVYYIDHKSKHAFQGDYLHYTDSAAIAFGGNPGPVAKEFSKGDTLFVHADTISMKGFHMNTPRMYREIYGVNNVRAFRTDIQAVCGFLVFNTKDSCMTMYDYPIVWSGNRQLVGDSIKAYLNDSTIRDALVYGNAFSIETLPDKKHYNQISSKMMHAYFTDGALRRVDAWGNVEVIFYHTDKDSTLIGHDYTETDTLRMFISPERKLKKIWMSKANGVISPMTQIPSDKLTLPHFELFDDVRPKDKDDIFRRAARKTSATVRNAQVALPPRQHVE
ncbi:OstA-like protein [Prevotella histicola]|uniref:Organic solvent tolerance-like N-terminal domain-containing protein n=1 Tax=Prevotella histicola F0411 TaxID=857291 RepID=G6AIX8_9BACT|nr:OstA-like protein [Prevotella histicola]EHG15377.1 hypothetical protein HMPREF9138_02055 [Prevotella histicola F0411]QUB84018.1 hypothetical protein J5A62_01320 [Prevotella histicola]